MTRWPAEWEKQRAIWFSWPHNENTWPGHLRHLQNIFAGLISTCSRYQTVKINAAEALHAQVRQDLLATKADLNSIELYDHPTNDVWCRDHGATLVNQDGKIHAIDWHFNAWGGKFPPWNLDDQIASHMAQAIGCESTRSPLFLEGGAIEGNGAGLVLCTEAVALNPNRNPTWSRAEIDAELSRCLGAQSIFWLPSGIEGDDTDGHIDDLVRFVREDAVVAIVEHDSSDVNYAILQRNRELLEDLRTVDGRKVEIIELPMPAPLIAKDWRLEMLPASYANFLIINDAVLVPVFEQAENDKTALGILTECFPDREVIGVDCRDIVFEGGAIHCISQQEPLI